MKLTHGVIVTSIIAAISAAGFYMNWSVGVLPLLFLASPFVGYLLVSPQKVAARIGGKKRLRAIRAQRNKRGQVARWSRGQKPNWR